jgi:hypothetical protein
VHHLREVGLDDGQGDIRILQNEALVRLSSEGVELAREEVGVLDVQPDSEVLLV